MYLLNATSLAIEYFQTYKDVQYGILSHRWEDDEVTLQDMQNGSADKKHGYAKVYNSCLQARKEGLNYVWIDTCCIDKTSSAELTEAINSMFNWYRCAAICFAYLADVDETNALETSVWFTRGWTLQELVAPANNMKFFDAGWNELGDKGSLGDTLARASGVPATVLSGEENFMARSVAERMSWAANRVTTRLEDSAYSLIGLFGVNMPMLYGEGDRAFVRLQEEIIKYTDDHSVFAWHYQGDNDSATGLLAPSLAAFSRCSAVKRREQSLQYSTFALTNRGLSIQFPMLEWSYNIFVAFLNCVCVTGSGMENPRTIAIFLRPLDSSEPDQYARGMVNGQDRVLFDENCFQDEKKICYFQEADNVRAIFHSRTAEGPLVQKRRVDLDRDAFSPTKFEDQFIYKFQMKSVGIYVRQSPLDLRQLKRKMYGFWIRKFKPFCKSTDFDIKRDFSIQCRNIWDWNKRYVLMEEGCHGMACCIIAKKGEADSTSPSSVSAFPTPSMVLVLSLSGTEYRPIGILKSEVTDRDMAYLEDLDARIEIPKVRFSNLYSSGQGWSLPGRETISMERDQPIAINSYFHWRLYIEAVLIDGVETWMVDILWCGQDNAQTQCDECKKIVTGEEYYCCLSCEQYDCCLDCMGRVSESRHDAVPGNEKHQFQWVPLSRNRDGYGIGSFAHPRLERRVGYNGSQAMRRMRPSIE